MNFQTQNFGFNFNNSYIQLPEIFYTKIKPEKTPNPKLVIFNHSLAKKLGLDFTRVSEKIIADIFSGNLLPKGSQSIAQSYAGHQFGHFSILGDGRAHLIGEHTSPNGQKWDIQFKGSGKTPYSRQGDGKATLAPMLREYIMSEAMHYLKISSTRSLGVVLTGEKIYRGLTLNGAVLTRIAQSHIRVGTFQYARIKMIKDNKEMGNETNNLKRLADYAIDRHYPEIRNGSNSSSCCPYLKLLEMVLDRQIRLIVNWLRVGFIHGVMNTDNMSICGESIDYGPCAFMDFYHPNTVFSSIDSNARYAYANQPNITKWNLTRFAESILPLIESSQKNNIKAIEKVMMILDKFDKKFQTRWLNMMQSKIGINTQNNNESQSKEKNDSNLIAELLNLMQKNKMDYTNTFRDLTYQNFAAKDYKKDEFKNWLVKWKKRIAQNQKSMLGAIEIMKKTNPVIIPRNHQVEQALNLAEEKLDYSKLNQILKALKNPYSNNKKFKKYRTPPKENEIVHQTFCGT